MTPLRVAVFGGSFDPPHVAHVMAAAWLLSAAPIDSVWVLPVHRHPLAKALTPFEQRLTMCRLAFGLFGERVVVREDERCLGGDGRTLDLLNHLRRTEPGAELRLVVGMDQIRARHRWHAFADVARLAPPIVLGRTGVPDDPKWPALVHLPAVSSTAIRRRLAAGQAVEGELPGAVAAWIEQEGLYR